MIVVKEIFCLGYNLLTHRENTYFSWQKASAIAECHRKFWRLIYSWNVYEILICLYELVGHSIWNHLTFLTWPPWILLKFCQLNLTIKKWKYWKFYYFITCGSEIMTTQSMDSLAWMDFLAWMDCLVWTL